MMITRCPACQTVFRLRPEQLHARGGEVRCGHCFHPFNALENTVEVRDVLRIEGTPIDYLDFASPEPGLGGKLGLDATRKRGPETRRPSSPEIVPDAAVEARMATLWAALRTPTTVET